MSWTTMAEGYATFRGEKGVATVESLRDGTWRWEGYPADPVRSSFDMDGWWGICQSDEEARSEAEKYLSSV